MGSGATMRRASIRRGSALANFEELPRSQVVDAFVQLRFEYEFRLIVPFGNVVAAHHRMASFSLPNTPSGTTRRFNSLNWCQCVPTREIKASDFNYKFSVLSKHVTSPTRLF